ncbi:membrane protein [Levilactobacillus zymae]|uniref:Membrane protein n=1 Tax=Levilactobacillus zymae TaxID=267363 RepID=A0ABQ0WVN1_9LACO|nr:YfhO family protein [Levilactobacillus zymae]QFR60456.1 YfhO family protein [Levilactobacillus zymae]GEO71806.1 membrane protein [Levilactobacillus zymae]
MPKKKRRWALTPKQWTLWGAFLTPLIIMTVYFAYRQMAPFGSSSLLTVDLGQQYVDFFAYLRRTILHDPSAIFYSFSNGLGGEMVGNWAYYLLSPLNLLLLFFPGASLTSGIFLITVLKYGLAGLSFGWLLLKVTKQDGLMAITFATAYALMGWAIANQLNIMWLDALVLLPLIFYGLIQLMTTGHWKPYIVWLPIMLVVNYYMAYMICLFLILAFIWLAADKFTTWRRLAVQTGRFALASLVSGALAAAVLLPTWWSLTQSKAQYTVQTFKWRFEFFPLKTLSKFFLGSFNFDQMPSGPANIFIGALALLGALFFFVDRRVALRSRLAAGVVTVFLALSTCVQPLDLLWHAGQFPVWYPYRFSFVICFWLIWLAAQTLTLDFRPGPIAISLVTLVVALGCYYVETNLKAFKYLKPNQFWLGILFVVFALMLATFPFKKHWTYPLMIFVIGVTEVTTNAYLDLNNISYVSQSEYGNYTAELQRLVNKTQQADKGFYRIGKTFLRTKGDAFQTGFNGGSVFSSALPKATPTFMGHIGVPDGDGFVEYSNGTLLTDSLLNMKYYFKDKQLSGALSGSSMLPASSNKADLADYRIVGQDHWATRYQNPYALPMGYAASNQILTLKNTTADPAQYQANWLAALTGNSQDQHLFTAENFNQVAFQNINQQSKITGAMLQKKDLLKPGSITLTFKPKDNAAYYLTMGSTVNPQNATFTLNGKSLAQYPTYRNTVIVSAADHAKGQSIKLTIQLKKGSLWLQNFTLYRLDTTRLKQATTQLKQHPWRLTQQSNRKFSGTVTATAKSPVLNTSIPYSQGWHATVNGHAAKTYKTVGMFTAVKLRPGTNHVTLAYWPPFLNLGLIISGATLLLVCGWWLVSVRRRR